MSDNKDRITLEAEGYIEGGDFVSKATLDVKKGNWAAELWGEHKRSIITGAGGIVAAGVAISYFF